MIVPKYPFVSHVIWDFQSWEERNFPQDAMIMGIEAVNKQIIWEMGMSSRSDMMIRDCSSCTFYYCFHRILERSML